MNRLTVPVFFAVGGEMHATFHERRRTRAEGVDVRDVIPDEPSGLFEVELELGDGGLDLGRVMEELHRDRSIVGHGEAIDGD